VIASSNLQTLPLDSLVAGQTYLLVITNSPGAVTLQFKHHDDPVTRNLPTHVGMSGAVVVTTFLCPSSVMALVWNTLASNTPKYYVSLTPITEQEF
jgi:hypothetical protein